MGGVIAQIQSKPAFCRVNSGHSYLVLPEATVAAADAASAAVAGITASVVAAGVAVVAAPSMTASAVAASADQGGCPAAATAVAVSCAR